MHADLPASYMIELHQASIDIVSCYITAPHHASKT